MSTIISIGIGILSFFTEIEKVEAPKEFYPTQQSVSTNLYQEYSDFYYSTKGELLQIKKNNSDHDNFYIKFNDLVDYKISVDGKSQNIISNEVGYLARILSAESLTYVKKGKVYKVSMLARVCIAESIRNRKESDFGFFAKYNTYKSVISYTGYATYAKQFRDTKSWLKHPIAKKRFIEEVLPAAIFVYFNKTNFTNNATGFITPVKLSSEKYKAFQKRKLIYIDGVDPYYEFTFWKY